jgi:acyl-CoA reductase-like NAD-dependent aldehyde dehydrogenase
MEAAMRSIGHFIGGKEVAGTSGRTGDVYDPNTGEVQAKVDFADPAEVAGAIAVAQAAQPAWAATNPQRRARVLFKFLELVQREFEALAKLLSGEHGKTIADARGDIQSPSSPAAFPTSSRANSPKAPAPASTFTPCASRSGSSPASRPSTSRP